MDEKNKSTLEKEQAELGGLQKLHMAESLQDVGKMFCLHGDNSQEAIYEDDTGIKKFIDNMAMKSDDQVLLKINIYGKETTLRHE